jgi:hypothetical protein
MKGPAITAARELARAALVLLEQPTEPGEQGTTALWISQRTVETMLGVGARSFLEDVGGPTYTAEVIRRGKLRLTRTEDYLAFLRARSVAQPDMNDGAEGVLAELGLKVVAGGK